MLGAERAGAVARVRCSQHQAAAAHNEKNARTKPVPKLKTSKIAVVAVAGAGAIAACFCCCRELPLAAGSCASACCAAACCRTISSGGTAVDSAAATVARLPSLLVRCFFCVFLVLPCFLFALLPQIPTSPPQFWRCRLQDFVSFQEKKQNRDGKGIDLFTRKKGVFPKHVIRKHSI